jgi:hypothetical protein
VKIEKIAESVEITQRIRKRGQPVVAEVERSESPHTTNLVGYFG